MKRNPVVGDVLRLSGVKQPQVVIESEDHVDYDRTRGDSYNVYTFETMDKTTDGLPKMSPKVRKFYLAGGSMRAEGTEVKLADIEILGYTTVKKKVVTSYAVGKSMRKPAAGA